MKERFHVERDDKVLRSWLNKLGFYKLQKSKITFIEDGGWTICQDCNNN